MIITDKKYLRVIDLKHKKLSSSKKFILSNKISIIKNFSLEDRFVSFVNLSKTFGQTLDYNKKPYFQFNESSQQEIGFHTDGVSCLEYYKIPKYLFFYVEKWPTNNKGFFKVSSTQKIIQMLPKKYLQILKTNKLQYLNYNGTHKKFIKTTNEDVVSFQKYCLRKVNERWTLDMFLPLEKMSKDVKWEYKMKFENLCLNESVEILEKIRQIAESEECAIEFPLSSGDIMIINNERFFHGRNEFDAKVKRSLYRIQVLN